MNNMKKIITVLAALMLVTCNICGCASSPAGQVQAVSDDSIRIVATIFPEYDWVNNILGERAQNADVTLLLDNGVDMHSFQPTAEDILKIASCDMFIYVGGESDEWVDDALAEATNKDMVVINLLDALGDKVKAEEIVEGMEAEEEEEEGEEEEEEYDEHVWLSLRNASILCDAITDGLCTVDPDGADTYRANNDSYKAKLDDLDGKYKDVSSQARVKTVLFGDRFPFRYMTDDYGLDYYAAFVGCSAETEASFETIVFLAEKTDELGLGAIMTIEGSDHGIAETIRDNTSAKDQQILTLDSMQSTTKKDAGNGTSYLSVMTSNLEVLKQALN